MNQLLSARIQPQSENSSSASPAEIYDSQFVPALFQQWGGTVAGAAKVRLGQQVLDVACGTGALMGAVASLVGDQGKVTGLDINPEMLAVARRKFPQMVFQQGDAHELPFADHSFDAVVSQFGFMFFENQVKALQNMVRVLKPGGHLAVAVCDALDHSPGYAVLSELLHRLFGESVAQSFRAPFTSGDRDKLLSCAKEADPTGSLFAEVNVARHDGWVQFPSIAALVSTERACVWTLGGLLDDAQFEQLASAAEESLRPFRNEDGSVRFVMPLLLLTLTKLV